MVYHSVACQSTIHATKAIFSRVLRDFIGHHVGRSVRPSLGLSNIHFFKVFKLQLNRIKLKLKKVKNMLKMFKKD